MIKQLLKLSRLELSRLGSIVIFLTLLSACQTLDSKHTWPSDIPDRQLFVSAYEQQTGLPGNGPALEKHLVWVKRFYKGSVIYPIGWNKMTEMLLQSLKEGTDFPDAEQRLEVLGKRICIEWAQENHIAKIRSANIAVWGTALRKAVKNKQQKLLIEKVEDDVEALISGQLNTKEISLERYYETEDYDDF